MLRVKQVILIRRDLKMRRGKEIAQGSHASMDFLIEAIRSQIKVPSGTQENVDLSLSAKEVYWMLHGMAKICLQVASEEELLHYHTLALASGIKSHLIRDSGRTEFHGVPTYTACAIGPDEVELIDNVCSPLSLY